MSLPDLPSVLTEFCVSSTYAMRIRGCYLEACLYRLTLNPYLPFMLTRLLPLRAEEKCMRNFWQETLKER
jgi:hypothetical protein